MYVQCLGRAFDVNGLESWCKAILTKKATPEAVAHGFFTSAEFVGQNTTNIVYVQRLYQALFGRAADTDGLNSWLSVLAAGRKREAVLNGFLKSPEYIILKKSFGL